MTTYTIKHRWTLAVLFETTADSLRLAVEAAVAAGADLRGANLGGADLTPIRDDFWAVLSAAPSEVPALIDALKAGYVDGSTYTGECACLVGTIAKAHGCGHDALPTLKPNASRPAERFFMGISAGDTPDMNQASARAVQWAEEWLARMRSAFGPVAP